MILPTSLNNAFNINDPAVTLSASDLTAIRNRLLLDLTIINEGVKKSSKLIPHNTDL